MTTISPDALLWPAPERNKVAIAEVLASHLQPRLSQRRQGQAPLVLEIASGSGQHVAHYALHLDGLTWLPSDIEELHLRSIAAWRETLAPEIAARIEDPIALDVVSESGMRDDIAGIVCANMIHIAPWSATQGLMRLAQAWLTPGAPLLLYGPFRRGGLHTSASNQSFDESLKERDPRWGVRDLEAVDEVAGTHGLRREDLVAMPANNLCALYVRGA